MSILAFILTTSILILRMFFVLFSFRHLGYLSCIIRVLRLEKEIERSQIKSNPNVDEMKRKESDLERWRIAAVAEKRDAAILDLIEGFMESALQLILQLYLCIQLSLPLSFARGWYNQQMS